MPLGSSLYTVLPLTRLGNKQLTDDWATDVSTGRTSNTLTVSVKAGS